MVQQKFLEHSSCLLLFDQTDPALDACHWPINSWCDEYFGKIVLFENQPHTGICESCDQSAFAKKCYIGQNLIFNCIYFYLFNKLIRN